MSVGRRIVGAAAAGAAGVAVAGGVAGVAQRRRTIARRGLGDGVGIGDLSSPPLTVVADDGVDLHVEVDEPDGVGDDDLTIVFAHGYCLNLDCWHFQREHYRGRVRSVYYDQRSHGRSARSTPDHATIEQLGRDLLRVVEATAPGPVVIVGHSMGGMSLISLAVQHPELFGDKVVGAALLSTTAGGLDPGRVLFPMLPLGMGGAFMGRAVRTLDRGHKIVDLVRRWGHAVGDVVTDTYAFGDDVPESYVDFVFGMLDATPFSVVAEFYPAFAGLDHFGSLSAFGQVPTSIICGTDDKITGIGHSRKLHSRIPGSSLLECEGAGHMVLLEHHDAVNAELDDLLSRAQAEPLAGAG